MLRLYNSMFVADDENLQKLWPTSGGQLQTLLKDLGYSDPKQYFVCLNDIHPDQWDIMESNDLQ